MNTSGLHCLYFQNEAVYSATFRCYDPLVSSVHNVKEKTFSKMVCHSYLFPVAGQYFFHSFGDEEIKT